MKTTGRNQGRKPVVALSAYRAVYIAAMGALAVLGSCGDFPTWVGMKELQPVTPIDLRDQVAGGSVDVEVLATSSDGKPLAGVKVTFTASGGGTANPSERPTGSDGKAKTTWTFDKKAGEPNELTASGERFSQKFTAQTKAGAPAKLRRKTPAYSSIVAGTTLVGDQVPSVDVTDQFDNLVTTATTPVQFSVTTGGGSLNGGTQTEVTVDAVGGVAKVASWALGKQIVPNTVEAKALGSTIAFTTTPVAGDPALFDIEEQPSTTAIAGTPVVTPPAVKVTDRFGNPLRGADVKFSVTTGGGFVSTNQPSEVRKTLENGVARPTGWVLGKKVGENKLTAEVVGFEATLKREFTAQGTHGPAATLALDTVTSQKDLQGTAGRVVRPAPAVKVLDLNGNLVTSTKTTVNFTVTLGGGSVNNAQSQSVETNGGVATVDWKLGNQSGENRLAASASTPGGTALAGSPVEFIADGKQKPTLLTVVAGSSQQGEVAKPVSTLPRVKVTDENSQPVKGIDVLFSVTAGQGTVESGKTTQTVATDDNGEAAVTVWVIDQITSASNVLEASLPGFPEVAKKSMTATGTPGPIDRLALDPSSQLSYQASAGSVVSPDPAVRVTDQYGNLVPSSTVDVTFSVKLGMGTIANGQSQTVRTSGGIAKANGWKLGPTKGNNSLEASALGLKNPVTFTATATQVPTTLAVVTPSIVSATVDRSVSPTPKVKVTDANGLAVAAQFVVFKVTATQGTVANSAKTADTVQTDSLGEASVSGYGWKIGRLTSIVNTLEVSLRDHPSVTKKTITANGSPDVPFKLVKNSTPADAPINALVSPAPSVTVQDQFGNNVGPNVLVTFTATNGSTSPASPTDQPTNSNSVASIPSWTLSGTPGANVLRAKVKNYPSVDSAFTVTGFPPSQIDPVGSPGTTGTVGSTKNPKVVVKDSKGRPVPQVDVAFVARSQNNTGSVASPTVKTSSTSPIGEATVAWTLGDTALTDSDTLVAKVTGVTNDSVTYVVTATAGATPLKYTTATAQQVDTGAVLQVVSLVPSVKVVDKFDNIMKSYAVAFSVGASGGTVSPTSKATDNAGVATVTSWTLGDTTGTYTVSAGGVMFTAYALMSYADTSRRTYANSSNPTAVQANQPLQPSVLIVDNTNAAKANAPVVWSIVGSNGAFGTNPNCGSTVTTAQTVNTGGLGKSVLNGAGATPEWCPSGVTGDVNQLRATYTVGGKNLSIDFYVKIQ